MLRSFFFRSRPPLLREGGECACLKHHPANDTWQITGARAPTSHRRSSACVKRNLDSSACPGGENLLATHLLQDSRVNSESRSVCNSCSTSRVSFCPSRVR